MTIKQAIEKAIEGGYHRGQIGTSPIVEINCDFAITETKGERNHYGLAWVWLDPLFWQSLGKAMGWGDEMVCIDETGHPKEWGYYFHCPVCGEIVHGERQECPSECETDYPPIESWKYHWHRFIDHLAEGKDAESFFSNL